jgi:cellulose synthase/poly-beta-1,6-N-acetylglucosamine synthase-like glycosyltransferase
MERMMEIAASLLVGCWLVASLLATLGCAWTLHLLSRRQPQPLAEPPVLVIVPVRGTAGLAGFLAGLAAQDWPGWHAAFAVESADDPASAMLAAALPGRSTVVVAGAAERRGQKLHQLLAALPALRPEDAALVTLDADTVPSPGLLRALLRPVRPARAISPPAIAGPWRHRAPGWRRAAWRWSTPRSPPCRAAPAATCAGVAPPPSAAPRWPGSTCHGCGTARYRMT